MRSGKLDRTIRIDRYGAGSVDDFGTPGESFTPVATVRAQVVQANAEESVGDRGGEDQTTVIFRTRWLSGVTNADRISHNGSFFNIREVKEIGRREGLELVAVARRRS
jgi:SPP1 family predicted phage head-tail adaptor